MLIQRKNIWFYNFFISSVAACIAVLLMGSNGITATITVSRIDTDDIVIPQFDSSLGTLESVDLTVTLRAGQTQLAGSSSPIPTAAFSSNNRNGWGPWQNTIEGFTPILRNTSSNSLEHSIATPTYQTSGISILPFAFDTNNSPSHSHQAYISYAGADRHFVSNSAIIHAAVSFQGGGEHDHPYSQETVLLDYDNTELSPFLGDSEIVIPAGPLRTNSSQAIHTLGSFSVAVETRDFSKNVFFSSRTLSSGLHLHDFDPRFTTSATFTYTPSLTIRLDATGTAGWDAAADWNQGVLPLPVNDVLVNTPANVTLSGPTVPTDINSLTLSPEAGSTSVLSLSTAGTITVSAGITAGNRSTINGTGLLQGSFTGAAGSMIDASTGDLTLGDTGRFDGFATEGAINVAANKVTVGSRGVSSLGAMTALGGGELLANGNSGIGRVTLGPGDAVVGNGRVNARISAAVGSTIAVDAAGATGGVLRLGDANAVDGFTSEGSLIIGDGTSGKQAILEDANEAVLGSYTELIGDGTDAKLTAGTAVAGDTHVHLLLGEGKNLVGEGVVEGNFKNQGNVIGNSTASGERIVFDAPWTVSGIGTFENTLVLGTFAPGNSPAISLGENQGFGGTIEIELGGTTPGNGPNNFDQIIDAGEVLLLDGTDLAVMPWNGFEPAIGDTFEFLQASDGIVGSFDDLFVDPFFLGLGIDFELSYDDGTASLLAVAAGLPGDFDLDNDVDGADFLAWQRGFGSAFDSDDLTDWEDGFGTFSALAASAVETGTVPEPSTGLLLLIAASVLSCSANRWNNRAAN